MPKKIPVTLTLEQQVALQALLARSIAPARTLTHARILLKADAAEGQPVWSNAALAGMLEVREPALTRVRKRFHAAGLEAALHRKSAERR